MFRARLALLAVPALLMSVAPPGSAAISKNQIVDRKGDSLGGVGSLDLLSVRFSTQGLGRGRTYVPKKLVVTMTLAEPPTGTGDVDYVIKAFSSDCGTVEISWAPGNASGAVVGDTYATFGRCLTTADSNHIFLPAKVSGTTATWVFALSQIGMTRGSLLRDFRADVHFVEPAMAVIGTDFTDEEGLGDTAVGIGSWRVS